MDLEGLQSLTLLKGIVADGGKGNVIIELNGCELDVILEGVVADGGNVCACTHAEGGQSRTTLEGSIANGDLTSCGSTGALNIDQSQRVAVLECVGTDAQRRIAGAVHGNGLEVRTTGKGVAAHMIDVSGDHNGGDVGIAAEDVISDAADTYGSLKHTGNSLGNVENGESGRVCIAEEILHGGVDGTTLLYQDGGQGRQGVQHAHVCVKGGDASGKLQHLDLVQTVESAGMNGHVTLTIRSELDGLQCIAVIECVFSNGGDGLGNDDLGDGGIVECMRTDGVHRHIVHHLGEGVCTGLGSGEDLQVIVTGCCVKVDQRAVVGGVEALVGAVIGLVHLEGLQLGAAVECADTDVTDGIGHGDGLQTGAILECIVRQLGDGNPLVGSGNADLSDGAHLGTSLDRIGTVGQQLEGQHVGCGIKEGIYVQILCEGVGSQAITLFVGDLGALTIGIGVPALEEADIIGHGRGNRQGKGLVEQDGLRGSVLEVVHDLGIHVEDDLVLVGLPVCEQDHGAGAVEHGIGILLTVALCSVRHVVPAVECEAGKGQIARKGHGVTHGQILGDLAHLGTSHIGNGIGVDLHGDPIGALQLGATDLNDVQTGLGQHDLGGGGIVDGHGNAAVDTDLKACASNHGRPVDRVVCVGQSGNQLVVAHGDGSAECGCLAVLDGADRDLIDVTHVQSQTLGLSQIKGGAVDGEGLVSDLDLVGGGAAVGPADDGIVDCEALGSSRSRLVAGGGGGLGGEVTLGDGGYGDGDVTREVSQAEGEIHDLMEGLGVLTDGDLHGVVGGVGHRVPYERITCLIVGQTRYGLQNALVDVNGGDGLGIALSHGGDGEANAALLHGAVAKVVVGRLTVVVIDVIVTGITALDGDEVLLGVSDRIEDQSTVNDRKGGHAVQSLVAEVTDSGIRGILSLVGHGEDLDDVVTCIEFGEVHVLCGGAQRLVVKDGTVGSGNLQLICRSAYHSTPLHRGAGDGDLGGGKLITLRRPYGVEGGVCGQHRILGELGGQLLAVTIHTGEPTVEHVARTLGCHNADESSADGRTIGNSLGTLVARIKVDGVFGSPGDHLRPAGVEHGIGINEGGGEVEGSREAIVGVPAQKHEAVLDGIGRLGGGFAVHDLRIAHHTAAIGVIADGEADFLTEGHDGVAKGQSQGIAVQRGGGGALLILVEVENDLALVDCILTRRIIAGTCESELIAAAERELQFAHLQVVVVDACFRTLGRCVGVRRLTL